KNYAKIPIINLDFFDENNILNQDFKEQMQEILQLKIP
ncbi:ATP-dependent dethiobiotin synthetase BioD, partial [Campylobacter coli]|nr:ATP-dependent dethiobiotin synthetase BioD [Campylobacter coli]